MDDIDTDHDLELNDQDQQMGQDLDEISDSTDLSSLDSMDNDLDFGSMEDELMFDDINEDDFSLE